MRCSNIVRQSTLTQRAFDLLMKAAFRLHTSTHGNSVSESAHRAVISNANIPPVNCGRTVCDHSTKFVVQPIYNH